MATVPEGEEPKQTTTQRVKGAVVSEVTAYPRSIWLLALVAALAALAPVPFGPLAAGALVLVAAEKRRCREGAA